MKKTYKSNFDQISAIVADTVQFFSDQNIDHSLGMKVDLSLEELFVIRVA